MRTTALGPLEVSVVGLGCNNFGRGLDQAGAAAVVRAALDAGITLFETADVYGQGRAERLLSSALGRQRDGVVIATKFGFPVPGEPGSGGAHPDYVRRAVERSLRELDRDWIDLYQVHRHDARVPVEDTLGALGELVRAGKVRAVGCSDFLPRQLGEALAAAGTGDLPRMATVQVEYSAVNRAPEDSGLTRLCEREGVTVIPYRPLAKGLLAGRVRRGEQPAGQLAQPRYQRLLTGASFSVAEQLRSVAEAHGQSPVTAALAWLLARPSVRVVCPGATRPEQVRANAAAGAWEPDPEALAALEAAGRPPGGSDLTPQAGTTGPPAG